MHVSDVLMHFLACQKAVINVAPMEIDLKFKLFAYCLFRKQWMSFVTDSWMSSYSRCLPNHLSYSFYKLNSWLLCVLANTFWCNWIILRVSNTSFHVTLIRKYILYVLVPPQNVVITANGPLREGVSITLMCNSGSSNPESTITWYKDNTELSNLTDNIRHVRTENGDFNGKSTVSS